jgi:hypothetical protein
MRKRGITKPLDSGAARRFKFALGQAVYVASNNPIMQRRASEQFARDRQFKVAAGASDADFVFVAVLHWPGEEAALVVLPEDYSEHRADPEALRDHALWRGAAQLHRFRSEIKGLVQQFERDALQSKPLPASGTGNPACAVQRSSTACSSENTPQGAPNDDGHVTSFTLRATRENRPATLEDPPI